MEDLIFLRNVIDAKCEFIKDEKMDIIVKMSFYREALIHVLDDNNFKKIARLLKQLSNISGSIMLDCDTEHLAYSKIAKLLDENKVSEIDIKKINGLLSFLDDIYLYRNNYFESYCSFLKESVDNPSSIYRNYSLVLKRNEVMNYVDKMMAN